MSPVRGCPVCGAPGCARHARRRPARRPYSGTALERQVRAEVLELYGAACHYCQAAIDLEAGAEDPLELAHLTPHVDGGAFDVENIRPSHRSCNRAAGATTLGEL